MNNKILRGLFLFFSLSSIAIASESVSQTESDAARISMLEKAFAPATADRVAEMFAKANKERNGAVQFMLFSDQLKNEHKSDWPYWVSGTSSPWITGYSIKKTSLSKGSYQFDITYQWATADGPFKPALEQKIVVEPVPKNANSSQKWWISKFVTVQ
ncbi:hypothetical protein BN59_03628 [Legionella massiliensis]|uniref:Uncharacterized protein n=1 Tax=Legionella massiliensis TaxID=1034943 RepID=A0A078KY18_9GAMM|nr:hypothetical protein [Legionella massiliensis]CDZ79310.1 hypothetical protein BN59_03628 [Legionella massiliensis]CEE15048.1 hypothetical protein BN1094_03628 [Legionella massiliensis]